MLETNDLYNSKNRINPFEFLKNLPDEQILLMMEDEDIGTRALVLAQITTLQSARVMEKLDADDKVLISLEMSNMKSLGEAGYAKLGDHLAEKLVRMPSINNFVVDGTDEMVSRLLMMTPVEQEMLVKKLKTQDPSLYGKIRDNYLFFNDIDKLDSNTAKEVMLGVDDSILAIVIATSGNAIKEYLLSLMNERKRAMVEEKLKSNGSISGESDSSREARAEFVKYSTGIAKLRNINFTELHKKASTFNSSAIEEDL
jgi:flagellar motor switch protein FliG